MMLKLKDVKSWQIEILMQRIKESDYGLNADKEVADYLLTILANAKYNENFCILDIKKGDDLTIYAYLLKIIEYSLRILSDKKINCTSPFSYTNLPMPRTTDGICLIRVLEQIKPLNNSFYEKYNLNKDTYIQEYLSSLDQYMSLQKTCLEIGLREDSEEERKKALDTAYECVTECDIEYMKLTGEVMPEEVLNKNGFSREFLNKKGHISGLITS